jgi:hypothetical protein
MRVSIQLQTNLDNYECVEEKVLSLSVKGREGVDQGKMYKEGSKISIEGWMRICTGERKGISGRGTETERTNVSGDPQLRKA